MNALIAILLQHVQDVVVTGLCHMEDVLNNVQKEKHLSTMNVNHVKEHAGNVRKTNSHIARLVMVIIVYMVQSALKNVQMEHIQNQIFATNVQMYVIHAQELHQIVLHVKIIFMITHVMIFAQQEHSQLKLMMEQRYARDVRLHV